MKKATTAMMAREEPQEEGLTNPFIVVSDGWRGRDRSREGLEWDE